MKETFEQLVARQHGVFRRRQAMRHGYTAAHVDRLLRNGDWVTIRHGIYATGEYYAARQDPLGLHRVAAAGRLLAIGGDTVISHRSAALLHRINLLDAAPAEPVLTRHRPDGAGRMTAHDLYLAPVPLHHRLPGRPMTTAARAVADCARTLSRDAAFVTVESALHLGLDRGELLDALAFCAGWPGAAEARDLLMMAGLWSESPLESIAMLWCRDHGLPVPEQQLTVRSVGGQFLGRVDLIWEQHRTVAELDGRKKYDAEGDDTRPARVFWDEKRREDALRDHGLEVARGYWTDGADGGAAFANRVRRAFARGAAHTGAPTYRVVDERARGRRGPLATTTPAVRIISESSPA